MSTLPKIKLPEYEHFLVGLGRTVKFRPFTNQEQKILLMAKEESEKDKNAIIRSVEQIINNCILDDDINIKNLTTFDIEDIFLRIRSKSVGETVTVKYSHDYEDSEGIKKTAFASVDINLDDVKVNTHSSHSKLIKLSDEFSLQMRYPTFEMTETVKDDEDLAISCIECIIHGDDVYNLNDFSKDEIMEFYDSMDTRGLLKIKEFFDTMPSLSHTVELDFGIKKQEVTLRGLNDFFT